MISALSMQLDRFIKANNELDATSAAIEGLTKQVTSAALSTLLLFTWRGL